jgi:hypothetical protein
VLSLRQGYGLTGYFFLLRFSLGLPSGIGKATNEVGFHWANKEK